MMTDLTVYEDTKQYLGFDPDAQLKLPQCPALGEWNLDSKHPRSVQGYIADLRSALHMETGAFEVLRYEVDVLSRLPERSEDDADKPAQQETPAAGRPEREAGGTGAESAAGNPESLREAGETSGDQGGEA